MKFWMICVAKRMLKDLLLLKDYEHVKYQMFMQVHQRNDSYSRSYCPEKMHNKYFIVLSRKFIAQRD